MPTRIEQDAAEWRFGQKRPTTIWAIVPTILVSAVLAGCGGTDVQQPQSVPKMSDLTRHASVQYQKDATEGKIKEISVPLGSIVYITIRSDVPGVARLDEYNVIRRVTAGKKAALVVSADYPGVFDLSFDRKKERDRIARLHVGEK